ncbi:MAG: hypothetical protein IJ901_08210 [Bacteroidaceae bacterium]|nr:hypothetical protein [Bacteroidaceae bacterium]
MKKVYIQPLTTVENVKIESFLQVPSVTGVGGNAGITQANSSDEIPTTADTKGRGDYGSDSNFGSLW